MALLESLRASPTEVPVPGSAEGVMIKRTSDLPQNIVTRISRIIQMMGVYFPTGRGHFWIKFLAYGQAYRSDPGEDFDMFNLVLKS